MASVNRRRKSKRHPICYKLRTSSAAVDRALVSANRFFIAPLLHLAIADLDPSLGPPRISVGRSLKIVERVVIVAEPQRIDTAAIPDLGQRFGLSPWFSFGTHLIEGNQFAAVQRYIRDTPSARFMFWPLVTFTVTIPITSPRMLKSGLPLLPCETGAVT
jgi:hypothetical protein